MAKYHGFRVIKGSTRSGQDNLIGTIVFNKNFPGYGETLAYVQWDDGTDNNYAIGYEGKFDLLIYDNSYHGAPHVGFHCKHCSNDKDIIGTMWSCLCCTDKCLCTSCYMHQTIYADHNFCRFDTPNGVGYFVGGSSKCDKYLGIVKDSIVKNSGKLDTHFSGKVDIIDFNYTKKHPIIKIQLNNGKPKNIKKYQKLKLAHEGRSSLNGIEINIEKNHLKVLGHNPIFNDQLYQTYKSKLDDYVVEFTNDISFANGDIVYIDCFTVIDLKEFQKGKGESNTKIEELIGKPGIVTHVDDLIVRIHYDTLAEDIPVNKKAIFNKTTNGQKIIRITNDIKVIEIEIKVWIDNIGVKADNKKWYPNDSMFNMISGKLGVIIMDNLPDNLVAVRFKMHRYSFCMLLPQKVCLALNDTNDVLANPLQPCINLDIELSELDSEIIEILKRLLDENDISEFGNQIKDISRPVWNEIFHHATEQKRTEFMKILIEGLKDGSTISEYILRSFTRQAEFTPEQWDLILDSSELDFTLTFSDYDNMFLVASKKGYYTFIEKVLARDKYKNVITSHNVITGFTALHYAVENNNCALVRLLIEQHNCSIYQKTKDHSTALHMSLQHYYLEVLLTILEVTKDDLIIDITDEDHNTILHLAASLPTEDMMKQWHMAIDVDGDNVLKRQIVELNEFIAKYRLGQDFDSKMEPIFILSSLILQKGKNSNRIWNQEINRKNQTPSNIFDNSIKELKKDCSVASVKNVLRLFKRYQNEHHHMEMCQFCKADFARVTYKPCGHTLHCFHCSFMPYRCTECGEDIMDKCIGEERVKDFEAWTEAAKNVTEMEYPENMNDWLEIIVNMLQQRLCPSCKVKSSNVFINCGHSMCKSCQEMTKKCCICQVEITNVTDMKSLELH